MTLLGVNHLVDNETYQQITSVSMHVLVHELQYRQPQSCESRQCEQRSEMLQKYLNNTQIMLRYKIMQSNLAITELQVAGFLTRTLLTYQKRN